MFCRARRVLHSTFYIQDVVRVEAIERAAVHDSLAERAGSVQPLMHQPGQSKCWMLGCEQQGGRDRGTVSRPKVTVAGCWCAPRLDALSVESMAARKLHRRRRRVVAF